MSSLIFSIGSLRVPIRFIGCVLDVRRVLRVLEGVPLDLVSYWMRVLGEVPVYMFPVSVWGRGLLPLVPACVETLQLCENIVNLPPLEALRSLVRVGEAGLYPVFYNPLTCRVEVFYPIIVEDRVEKFIEDGLTCQKTVEVIRRVVLEVLPSAEVSKVEGLVSEVPLILYIYEGRMKIPIMVGILGISEPATSLPSVFDNVSEYMSRVIELGEVPNLHEVRSLLPMLARSRLGEEYLNRFISNVKMLVLEPVNELLRSLSNVFTSPRIVFRLERDVSGRIVHPYVTVESPSASFVLGGDFLLTPRKLYFACWLPLRREFYYLPLAPPNISRIELEHYVKSVLPTLCRRILEEQYSVPIPIIESFLSQLLEINARTSNNMINLASTVPYDWLDINLIAIDNENNRKITYELFHSPLREGGFFHPRHVEEGMSLSSVLEDVLRRKGLDVEYSLEPPFLRVAQLSEPIILVIFGSPREIVLKLEEVNQEEITHPRKILVL